jgi:hypothetical protein
LTFLARQWKLTKYGYAAFLVHTPLLVNLQCLFGVKGWEGDGGRVDGVRTAVVVGVLSVVETWRVGAVVKVGVKGVG